MDVGLFRDEQFSSFDSRTYLDPEDSTSLDDLHSFNRNELYEWDLGHEQELNGDLSLIPSTNGYCEMNTDKMNESMPVKEDFEQIMDNWQQFVTLDSGYEDFAMGDLMMSSEEDDKKMDKQKELPFNELLMPSNSTFDITKYLSEDEPKAVVPSPLVRKVRAGVKKIDMKAQRYILDDDEPDVDVETVSECDNIPVLEAGDVNSLLEQFEATEFPDPQNFRKITEPPEIILKQEVEEITIKEEPVDATEYNCTDKTSVRCKPEIVKVKKEFVEKDVKIKEEVPVEVPVKIEPKSANHGKRKRVKTEPQDEVRKVKRERKVARTEAMEVDSKQDRSVTIKQEPAVMDITARKVTRPAPVAAPPKRTAPSTAPPKDTAPSIAPPKDTAPSTAPPLKRPKIEVRQAPPQHQPSPPNTARVPPAKSTTTVTLNRNPTNRLLDSLPDELMTNARHCDKRETTSVIPPIACKRRSDVLPDELITRIKQSGVRKTISVIPPIPNKRRGAPRPAEVAAPRPAEVAAPRLAEVAAPQVPHNKPVATAPQVPRNKPVATTASQVCPNTVQLDHDYCSSKVPYSEHTKKDSGFESAEEDDRAMMGKQPVVKNADGKLMVSLLKVNTIRNVGDAGPRRRLNLEEYKKRHEGFLKSQTNSQASSQNSSPISSTCGSPLPEDENTRRIKHLEKLERMAKEVLTYVPKALVKPNTPPMTVVRPPPVKLPADMEMKTLVSIGVNTDFKSYKDIDPVAPVEQLEQIKPLLKKANGKINSNSLITSLIENIPKVMSKTSESKGLRLQRVADTSHHGEDLTILHLPKNRPAKETANVAVQTNTSLIKQWKQSRYRRRRDDSTSSNSSSVSRRSAASSHYDRVHNESCSSGNSWSSRSSHSSDYYSSSSSSSSSNSPRYSNRERERLREVEERRVIYVGRISATTTKDDLRRRFQRFGPITNISLHFRNHGYLDNYGFVTFVNKLDAYEALGHGNDDPHYPKYELSFGGRRIFCKTSYSDLDNMRDDSAPYYSSPRVAENSFDSLLREAQEKMRKRKA